MTPEMCDLLLAMRPPPSLGNKRRKRLRALRRVLVLQCRILSEQLGVDIQIVDLRKSSGGR